MKLPSIIHSCFAALAFSHVALGQVDAFGSFTIEEPSVFILVFDGIHCSVNQRQFIVGQSKNVRQKVAPFIAASVSSVPSQDCELRLFLEQDVDNNSEFPHFPITPDLIGKCLIGVDQTQPFGGFELVC